MKRAFLDRASRDYSVTANHEGRVINNSPSCFNYLNFLPARKVGDRAVPNEEDMTQLISSEMKQLSIQEQQQCHLDVHGVTSPDVTEPDSDFPRLTEELKQQISSTRTAPAYNKAVFLNPEYVDSFHFQLMFLRSENFKIVQSAEKMIAHFKFKLDLFGPDRLARSIRYDDLDDDDREALNSGAVQILPEKDRAGRTVLFIAVAPLKYKAPVHQIRAIWYLLMSHIENDIDSQKNGFVILSYNLGYKSMDLHLDFTLQASALNKSIPLKIQAFHFCYDDNRLRPFLATLQLVVGTNARLRFRAFFGSYMEVTYAMLNFGVKKEWLPINGDGSISSNIVENYVKERIRIETEEKSLFATRGAIMHPLVTDVLLGRGRHQQEHEGNLALAELVDKNRGKYAALRKLEKTNFSRELVDLIHASGGRFLERMGNGGKGWVVVDEEFAREKVSRSFRTVTTRQAKDSKHRKKPRVES